MVACDYSSIAIDLDIKVCPTPIVLHTSLERGFSTLRIKFLRYKQESAREVKQASLWGYILRDDLYVSSIGCCVQFEHSSFYIGCIVRDSCTRQDYTC